MKVTEKTTQYGGRLVNNAKAMGYTNTTSKPAPRKSSKKSDN